MNIFIALAAMLSFLVLFSTSMPFYKERVNSIYTQNFLKTGSEIELAFDMHYAKKNFYPLRESYNKTINYLIDEEYLKSFPEEPKDSGGYKFFKNGKTYYLTLEKKNNNKITKELCFMVNNKNKINKYKKNDMIDFKKLLKNKNFCIQYNNEYVGFYKLN
tara:strand:+ start:45217 stop:45696 length:480 start_codon:yes stop_codon:yes gene_type:complete